MRTAAIVQARWGSTRLPGKVLEAIGTRTVLAHVLDRARRTPCVDVVVCAVPQGVESDPVAEEALRCGVVVFRGSETDVLERYLGAARQVGADIVLRVTSDCPLIDQEVCGAVLSLRAESSSEYAANNMPASFPHGLDCEAFTVAALAEAARTTAEPPDREHVTPWLRRAAHFKRVNLSAGEASFVDQRWTLDFPEDLSFLRTVHDECPELFAGPWRQLAEKLRDSPWLTAINGMRCVVRG